MDLAARIQRLEDIAAIERLKYRYWRCLDLELWDELAGCVTDQAAADYGDGRFLLAGAVGIPSVLSRARRWEAGSVSGQLGHHREIGLTSATAPRGTWALYNYLFNAAQKRSVRIGAYYHDEYVKVAGAWKIAHTAYTYVFREEWSREDTPSLRLVAP